FLHPWIAAQKAFLGRFENEAKTMSRLAHPHCVSVIDFGVDGAPYLVMDFVTGRTLRDVMLQGPVPVARTMKIAQQLLSGLSHAHAQGIVHRDLKPENQILAGRKPFNSENVGELIFMHREQPPPRLREAVSEGGYSPALEAAIDKALSKMPQDRFSSAGEFAAALAATPEGQGRTLAAAARKARPASKTTVDTVSAVRRRLGADAPAADPSAEPAPRQWRLVWIGSGFLLIVLVGLTIGRALRSHPAEGPGAPVASAPVPVPRPGRSAAPALPPPVPVPAPANEDPRIEQARQMLAA